MSEQKMSEPVAMGNLKVGGKYNWKGQPERLLYIGIKDGWHQFVKTDARHKVWREPTHRFRRIAEWLPTHEEPTP